VESIATVKPVTPISTAVTSPSVACVPIVASTAPAATVAPAGADEHATSEPIRPIVAVRRASIRRVAVVAVVAHWRTAHVARANPHAHTHLRL
jgi:hypothetical protein